MQAFECVTLASPGLNCWILPISWTSFEFYDQPSLSLVFSVYDLRRW